MNQQKTDFVFEVAEFTVMKWLSEVMERPMDELFHGGLREIRPIYINKSFKRYYEIKPEIVEYDFSAPILNFIDTGKSNHIKKQVLEAAGFVMYSIKTVFITLARIVKEHIEAASDKESPVIQSYFSPDFWANMGLALDEKNNTFYITYIHPTILKKDKLGSMMHKLLIEKKALKNEETTPETIQEWETNWDITMQQFNMIDKQIKEEMIEDTVDKWNLILKTKKRIGISIKEIKESDIPHHYKIKNLPMIDEDNASTSYEEIDI